MNPEQLEEQRDLTVAVQDLIAEVKQLNAKLALYAPREEVKTESRKRAWRFLASAVVIVLIAQALTMTTISYCFLDATPSSSKPFCSAMPGYSTAFEQSEVRLQRFEKLLSTIEQNQRNIADLQKRIQELEENQ